MLATARDSLPDNVDLQDLIADDPYTFTAVSANEIERTYAFVPLTAGNAYALGTWNTDAALLQGEAGYWRTIILAALMWLGSVLVIFLIMQLLVIRGIKRLRTQVRSFRDTRTIPAGEIVAKGELYDLEVDIVAMAETIVRDEAELEDAVHEKNVLLKEVHHRVKNNLQLINSIINMILRGAKSPETRTVVKRLQDRVMALASVHRTIYQAQSMDRVDASEIVREIVNQGVAIGLPRGSDVDIRCNLSPVSLYPDQAMPLSLLVSEAITNALKYVGGDNAFIAVDLSTTSTDDEDGTSRHTATLRIANTVGDTVDDDEGTGLGSQLLRAFTHQLDGEAVTSNHSGLYSFSTTFNISAFNPEESDFVEKRAEED
ncbi:sensory transduction histidine kinase, putative [Roseobacter denitrificans OCh 114]|uniref:histidine kinase n=1 Tax=Roseobacter denitrificans (strain ATCC 33942 / OCh 114) TaxID=375451 RepID=Q166R6_ROSDO|nr:sensory transduction histidine kinase, putative [Roseobacter denitrificans OCh 114]